MNRLLVNGKDIAPWAKIYLATKLGREDFDLDFEICPKPLFNRDESELRMRFSILLLGARIDFAAAELVEKFDNDTELFKMWWQLIADDIYHGIHMKLVDMYVKDETSLSENSIREIIIDGSHRNMRRLIIAMLEKLHEKPVDKLTFQFWQDTTYVQYQCASKVFSSQYNLLNTVPVEEQLDALIEEGYSRWGLNP